MLRDVPQQYKVHCEMNYETSYASFKSLEIRTHYTTARVVHSSQ